MSTTEDEFIDYELFTSPDFDPISFCNSLVLATNDSSDVIVDLNAPSSRVFFDIQEVEKSMKNEIAKSQVSFIDYASRTHRSQEITSSTASTLSSAIGSYKRLEKEILTPYETAKTLYYKAVDLRAITNILRSLTWFLQLVRQAEHYLIISTKNFSFLPKTVSACREADSYLTSHRELDGINIIPVHAKQINDWEQSVRARSQHSVLNFHISNDPYKIIASCQTLCILSPKLLFSSIDKYMSGQVSQCVNAISKSASAPAQLEMALQYCSQASENVSSLATILNSINMPSVSADGESPDHDTKSHKIMLSAVANALDTSDLISKFWRDVAFSLESKAKANRPSRRNTPSPRHSTRSDSPSISTSKERTKIHQIIKNAVLRSSTLDERGPEVQVMTHAINQLLAS